jgi:hypothetical protein
MRERPIDYRHDPQENESSFADIVGFDYVHPKAHIIARRWRDR